MLPHRTAPWPGSCFPGLAVAASLATTYGVKTHAEGLDLADRQVDACAFVAGWHGRCSPWSPTGALGAWQAVYAAAARTKTAVGVVTILINNAGIVTGKTLLECPDALMEKTVQVNTIAHFWTLKAFLPGGGPLLSPPPSCPSCVPTPCCGAQTCWRPTTGTW